MEYLVRLIFLIVLLSSNGEVDVPPMEYTVPVETSAMSLEELGEWIDQEEIALDEIKAVLDEKNEELDARYEELDALDYELDIIKAAYPDGAPTEAVYQDYQEKLNHFNLLSDEYNKLRHQYLDDSEPYNDRVIARNKAVAEYNRLKAEAEAEQ